MSTAPIAILEEHFSVINDPRTEYLVEHNLIEIIIIAVCAVICGADNWVHVANWAEEKTEWLREKGLKLENGTPSHDTFRRVFLRIDSEQFQIGSASWMKAVFEITKGQVIAIDGKQMLGSKAKELGFFELLCGQPQAHSILNLKCLKFGRPKAIRLSRRILLFTPSTKPLVT
ncbi:MAG: ISAs1 family transposase, partial [Chloroflexi bacterium]|nr:ISAs1 family transposase [Chloroflexota bacterium]